MCDRCGVTDSKVNFLKGYVEILCLLIQIQTFFKDLLPTGIETVGWDSSVGTANSYWVDGPEIEYRWGRYFPHPSRQALGPTLYPVRWIAILFTGDITAEAWGDYPPHLTRKLKKVYVCTPNNSLVSKRFLRWTLPLNTASWFRNLNAQNTDMSCRNK